MEKTNHQKTLTTYKSFKHENYQTADNKNKDDIENRKTIEATVLTLITEQTIDHAIGRWNAQEKREIKVKYRHAGGAVTTMITEQTIDHAIGR